MPESGWWQLSLHRLEHLLISVNFESPRFISECPVKIYLYFVFISLIWWQGVGGQLLKSKRFTQKSVFLASLKARSSANSGSKFLSGTVCWSWGAADSAEQVPSSPSLSSPCWPLGSPRSASLIYLPDSWAQINIKAMVQEGSNGQPWRYMKVSKSGHTVFK